MRILPLFAKMIVALIVTGCAASQSVQTPPEIRYTHLPALNLDVGRIVVESEYVSPFKRPNIEQEMPIPPEKLARTWANDRLRAVGSTSSTAHFIIKNAGVVETPLKVDESLGRLFKKEQSERYEGKLDVVLEIRDERGRVVAEASASVGRSRSVSEEITIVEREGIWRDISKSLVDDVNVVLEKNMRSYLGKYLVL